MGNVIVSSITRTPVAQGGGVWGGLGAGTVTPDSNYPEIPTEEIAVSLQRYVESTGSNANDGQLVANGGTGPWATIEYGLEQGFGSTTWRWLNLRGDNTAATGIAKVDAKYMGTTPGVLGTPFVVRQDPTSAGTLTINARLDLQGQSHVLVHSITQAGIAGWSTFTATGNDSHLLWRNITGIMTGLGGDNLGFVESNDVDYFGVINCDLTGPGEGGSIHGNTACIVHFQNDKFKIENNILSNAPRPYYFKHANQGLEADVDWSFSNNWLKGNVGQSFISGRFGNVENNIFDMGLMVSNGGGGIVPFGDTFRHNTFMSAFDIWDGDGVAISNDHVSLDNIIIGQYAIDQYGTSAYTNTCTSNYQLYGANIIFQGTTYTTLASWQAASVPAGQDINSVDGLPTFTGGATPTTIAGYKLNGGNGVNAASDGKDMGADTALVGTV